MARSSATRRTRLSFGLLLLAAALLPGCPPMGRRPASYPYFQACNTIDVELRRRIDPKPKTSNEYYRRRMIRAYTALLYLDEEALKRAYRPPQPLVPSGAVSTTATDSPLGRKHLIDRIANLYMEFEEWEGLVEFTRMLLNPPISSFQTPSAHVEQVAGILGKALDAGAPTELVAKAAREGYQAQMRKWQVYRRHWAPSPQDAQAVRKTIEALGALADKTAGGTVELTQPAAASRPN